MPDAATTGMVLLNFFSAVGAGTLANLATEPARQLLDKIMAAVKGKVSPTVENAIEAAARGELSQEKLASLQAKLDEILERNEQLRAELAAYAKEGQAMLTGQLNVGNTGTAIQTQNNLGGTVYNVSGNQTTNITQEKKTPLNSPASSTNANRRPPSA